MAEAIRIHSSDMEASIRRFFARHGYYRTPQGTFYHRQLRARLTEIGFTVLSIERLDSHPIWRVRLKATPRAQAQFLIRQPADLFQSSDSHGLLEQQLTKHVQRILKQLGQPARKDEIVVVRSGVYVHVAFVWPLGTPGFVGRSRKDIHPFQVSLVLRRWLREQRN